MKSTRLVSQINQLLQFFRTARQQLTAPTRLVRARNEQRQARLVAALFLVFTPIGFIIAAMPKLIYDGGRGVLQDPDVQMMFFVMGFSVFAYGLSRTKYYTFSAGLVIVVASLAVFASSMPEESQSDYIGLYYLVIPILLASILFSGRFALGVAVADLIIVYLMPQIVSGYEVGIILAGPFRFVFTMTVVIFLVSVYRNVLENDRQADLAESELRYRSVVEQASEGIALYALDTKQMVESNHAYQTMLGYTADEMLGLTLYDVVAHDRASIDHFVEQICRAKHVVIGERKHRRKDGSLVDVDVSVSLFSANARAFMCVVVRDITERKRIEEKISAHTDQLEALREINLELSAELDLDTLLQSITRRAMELCNADGSGFYRYVPERDMIERLLTLGTSFLPAGKVWARGEGLAGKVLATRQPMLVDDYSRWAGRSPTIPHDVQFSLIGVPVLWHDEILGVLTANRFGARPFSPAELEILIMFASHGAIAIRNARMMESEARERRRAETLMRANATLNETLNLESLLENILHAALQAVPSAEKGSVVLADDKTGDLCIRSIVGYSDPRVYQMRLAPKEGYTCRAMETGAPLLVPDVHSGEWLYTGDIPEVRALQSAVVAPMIYRGETIGVISLDNGTRTSAFDQADLELLAAFANQASAAIENAQLHQQIRASLAEKEILLKEIHHRVKNNLQIISSLLNLQEQQVKDQSVGGILRDSQNRVRSMALIHERLYRAQDLARVDFAEYIRGLTTHLFHSYGAVGRGIALTINAAPILLSVDTAIPCGLILNELVSNALKHAFPAGRAGKIEITLTESQSRQIELIVADDGIGIAPDCDWRNTPSLGLQLVTTLTSQLNGTIELERLHGTRWQITFTAP